VKILHTSDWHAGKAWRGQPRLDELAAVLDDLASVIERERIDLVLMTGDVFDTPSPPADAERLVFGFFRRLGRLAIPSVVIAGNHDSAARVDAWGQLAELAHVKTCGLPKPFDHGGCARIQTASGETAVVAMIPFVAPSRFVTAQALGAAPEQAATTYAARMQELVAHMSQGFDDGAVNVLMAHTHLDGAVVGKSERRLHVGDDWAASPQMLPARAHYVALGHIHRHQRVMAAPAPTWYAGAPMQLDFGEEGEPKCYNVIDARPRQPARVEVRPYVGSRPLRTLTVTRADLSRARDLATSGGAGRLVGSDGPADVSDNPHLRVIVDCSDGVLDPDINRKVREAMPGVVSVDLIRPTAAERPEAVRTGTLAPRELYGRYLQERGSASSEPLLAAFDALHEAALAAEAQS
jgi:exonuclease SbcD